MKLLRSYSLSIFKTFKLGFVLPFLLFFVTGFPSSVFVSSASEVESVPASIPVPAQASNSAESSADTAPDTSSSADTTTSSETPSESETKGESDHEKNSDVQSGDNNELVITLSDESEIMSAGSSAGAVTAASTRMTSSRKSAPRMDFIEADQEYETPVNFILQSEEINSATEHGPILGDEDRYGVSVANIGDLDGNGVTDIAVGAHRNDAGGTDRGAIFIHFRNADGSIGSSTKIDGTVENGPVLDTDNDLFGVSIANIGDLDGDDVTDIAVGSYGNDAGGTDRGAMFIIFLNTNGTPKSTIKIDSTTENGPSLSDGDKYGASVANIGDLDGNGATDIAVGAQFGDTNGTNDTGAVFIHFLNTNGSVKATKMLGSSTGQDVSLADADYYGLSVANLGDINADGITDIAVGAPGDHVTGPNTGAWYIHFMKADGSFTSTTRIDGSTPNGASLEDYDYYGTVASLGDLDLDGVNDVAVGAETFPDPVGLANKGEVLIHLLNSNGSIKATFKLDENTPNGPSLSDNDFYGTSIANMGDLNADGLTDFAVGAFWDDTQGSNRGTVYVHYVGSVTDEADILVSKTSLSLSENAGTDTFTVRLSVAPASDVVVTISSSNTSDVMIAPQTLTFTSSNWNVPQEVVATGVNDAADSNDTAIITVSINDAASDDAYDSVADKTLAVTLVDDDEPASGGGNNGGGGGGGGSTGGGGTISFGGFARPMGEVLGASTLSCEARVYLTKPVKLGAANNPNDVVLLEQYLNTYENANIPVDGIYSQDDFNRVVAWQEKYASEILAPWGISKGTGFVFITSLQKIKQVHKAACADSEMPIQILSCALPVLYPTEQVMAGGSNNNAGNVMLLERYLNTYESASLTVDGVYSQVDIDAVKKWQGPGSTGNVLNTDLAKIKQVHTARCALFDTPPEF